MNTWELLQLNIQFYQTVLGRTEEALSELNLEVKSFFLLCAVEQCRHPAELAKHLMIPKPTVTFMVKKLEERGYLKRKTVKGDLRKFELIVTPQGRKAIEQGQLIVGPAFEKSFSRLTKKEYETYVRIIEKMVADESVPAKNCRASTPEGLKT